MTGDAPLILVIEDEPPIRRFLRASLIGEGYRLAEAETGEQGLQMAAAQPPDLIILDLGLPDIDGLQVIQTLRSWSQMPIIILSARDQEKDKVLALDQGADDYLSKPFGMDELLARIRVALRHQARLHDPSAGATTCFRVGEMMIDQEARRVFVGGQGSPSHTHRIPSAHDLCSACWQGAHPPVSPHRGLGTRTCRRNTLPPCFYGHLATQTGGRSSPSTILAHRAKRGVSAGRRVGSINLI